MCVEGGVGLWCGFYDSYCRFFGVFVVGLVFYSFDDLVLDGVYFGKSWVLVRWFCVVGIVSGGVDYWIMFVDRVFVVGVEGFLLRGFWVV